MLLYGRDCVLPLDTVLSPRRKYYGEDYVPTMLQRLHAAFLHVADNTKHARAEVKRQADKRARQKDNLLLVILSICMILLSRKVR